MSKENQRWLKANEKSCGLGSLTTRTENIKPIKNVQQKFKSDVGASSAKLQSFSVFYWTGTNFISNRKLAARDSSTYLLKLKFFISVFSSEWLKYWFRLFSSRRKLAKNAISFNFPFALKGNVCTCTEIAKVLCAVAKYSLIANSRLSPTGKSIAWQIW